MLKGSLTALITPFRNGKVDEEAYKRLVEWQIAEGTNGLVPVGTTGESPTLSHDEHMQVVELCIAAAKKRVPVVAGTGSNSTAEAIELTEHAKTAGADAALVVTPYYNKPTQEGLYQHFKAISDAVDLPIVIYNIPGRSVIDMSVDTMARCFELKNVIGVKDATANMARASQQRLACRAAGKAPFVMLSGEDATALGFNVHGGQGCISVTSNIAPRLCADFQKACLAGDYKTALALAGPADAAARRTVRGDEPGPREVRGLAPRPVHRGDAAAAGADLGRHAQGGRRGTGAKRTAVGEGRRVAPPPRTTGERAQVRHGGQQR